MKEPTTLSVDLDQPLFDHFCHRRTREQRRDHAAALLRMALNAALQAGVSIRALLPRRRG